MDIGARREGTPQLVVVLIAEVKLEELDLEDLRERRSVLCFLGLSPEWESAFHANPSRTFFRV